MRLRHSAELDRRFPFVQQSRGSRVGADTQSAADWTNPSKWMDGCVYACPPAQWPQQNKLKSESLNYAAHKVQSVSFRLFFSHRVQLLFLSKLPLKDRKANANGVLVTALRPVVVCTRNGSKPAMCLLVGISVVANEESRPRCCQHQLLVHLLFIATTPDAAGRTLPANTLKAKYNLNHRSKK